MAQKKKRGLGKDSFLPGKQYCFDPEILVPAIAEPDESGNGWSRMFFAEGVCIGWDSERENFRFQGTPSGGRGIYRFKVEINMAESAKLFESSPLRPQPAH